MTLAPWDYLFLSFNSDNFPDLFHPTWIASLVLLVVLVVLYNVRTRALHRHQPYVDMWEWLWWTGLITFSLLIVEAVFVFDFIIVLLTEFIGIGTLVWIRFVRFPPILRARTRPGSPASATTPSRSSPTPRRPSGSARRAAEVEPSAAGGPLDRRDSGRDAHRDPSVRRRASTAGRATGDRRA